MAKVKITMGYPSAALSQGIECEAGDVITVEEELAKTWIAAGWADLVKAKTVTKVITTTTTRKTVKRAAKK